MHEHQKTKKRPFVVEKSNSESLHAQAWEIRIKKNQFWDKTPTPGTGSREGSALIQGSQALQLHGQQIRNVVQKELRHFREGLAAKEKSLNVFTVTLFGRTMAGKSTIREAITGGDGSTIGKGAQRTTRDIREYDWRNLRLIDTPGFGAFEGAEDRQLAFTKVDESDLIVFLLSSDGNQKESVREMAELNRLKKPVLFVLNVKHDLTKGVLRRRFLESPEKQMGEEAIRVHRNSVQKSVERHFPSTLREIRLLPVHAQAAWLSRNANNSIESGKLRDASGIVPLLHTLEDELMKRGPQRRIQTIIGGSSTVIRLLSEELLAGAEAFRLESDLLAEKAKHLGQRIENYVAHFPNKCRVAVAQHYAPLHQSIPSFVESNIREKDIQERWKKEVEALKTDEWAKGFPKQIADEIEEMLNEFRRELDFDLRLIAQGECSNVNSSRPMDWKRIAEWTTAAITVTGTVLFLVSNPAGWVTATIIGVGVCIGLISNWLPGRKNRLEAAKKKARKTLEAELAEQETTTCEELLNWFTTEVHHSLLDSVHEEVSTFRDGVSELAAKAEEGGSHLKEIDKELTKNHQKDLN